MLDICFYLAILRGPPLFQLLRGWGQGGPFKGERKSKDKVEVGGRGGEICEPEDRFNKSKDREVYIFCLFYSWHHLPPSFGYRAFDAATSLRGRGRKKLYFCALEILF